MKYSTPLCSCIVCHKEFSQKGIHTHFIINHIDSHESKEIKRLNVSNGRKNGKDRWETNPFLESYNYFPNYCKNKDCNKLLSYKQRNSKYCSHSCAVSVTNKLRAPKSEETKQKIAIANIGIIRKKVCKISFCVICNTLIKESKLKTCSKTCYSQLMSKLARNNPNLGVARSKNEIKLYELCLSHFKNVGHNENIFNGWDADILIHDIKTAVLWNGPWHYQEMPGLIHSLKQVQNRDFIKQKEIINAGWKCFVFEDRYYTPESAFKELVDSI